VGILALMLAALSVERCLPFAFETDDLVDTKRPQLTVLDRFVVFDQGHSAFPSVVRVPGGRVLVVFRNGIQHADPSGKIMMVSYAYDSVAKRFAPTDTNTIIDTPADDRDPHITALSNGTLLVNFFTRVELSPTSEDVEVHVSQSEDSGRSWHAWASFPNPWPARWLATSDAIHESPGGRLLMATYGVVAADGTSSGLLYQSRDAGRSWEYSGVIGRDPSQRLEFYEPAVAQLADRMVAALRAEPLDSPEGGFIYWTNSGDGGRAWSTPVRLRLWGYPSRPLELSNGALLLVYGYRRSPFGVQFSTSTDEGRAWSEPTALDASSETAECGYPESVELVDGSILTVYYLTRAQHTFVAGVHYRLSW
jgi:hypothetical protein